MQCLRDTLPVCADAVGDILQGLLAADFSDIPDAVGDVLAGLNRFADFRSAPDVLGLSGNTKGLASYFPDLLTPIEAPTGPNRILAALNNTKVFDYQSFETTSPT